MSYEMITPNGKDLYLNIHIEDSLENRRLCWDFIDELSKIGDNSEVEK